MSELMFVRAGAESLLTPFLQALFLKAGALWRHLCGVDGHQLWDFRNGPRTAVNRRKVLALRER